MTSFLYCAVINVENLAATDVLINGVSAPVRQSQYGSLYVSVAGQTGLVGDVVQPILSDGSRVGFPDGANQLVTAAVSTIYDEDNARFYNCSGTQWAAFSNNGFDPAGAVPVVGAAYSIKNSVDGRLYPQTGFLAYQFDVNDASGFTEPMAAVGAMTGTYNPVDELGYAVRSYWGSDLSTVVYTDENLSVSASVGMNVDSAGVLKPDNSFTGTEVLAGVPLGTQLKTTASLGMVYGTETLSLKPLMGFSPYNTYYYTFSSGYEFPGVNAVLMTFNTSDESIHTLATSSATIAPDNNSLSTKAQLYGFRNTTQVYLRCQSKTDATAVSQDSVLICGSPGSWTLTHDPGANVVATVTKAAPAVTRTHIIVGIQASVTAVAAIVAPVILVLRAGASGAGTILWQKRITVPAGETFNVDVTGLSIPTGAGIAATLEFTAAPGATNFEVINLQGYTVGDF